MTALKLNTTLLNEMQQFDNILSVVSIIISIIAGISPCRRNRRYEYYIVSVTERTRKSSPQGSWCSNTAIRLQFIIESMIICLIGGIIGIILELYLEILPV